MRGRFRKIIIIIIVVIIIFFGIFLNITKTQKSISDDTYFKNQEIYIEKKVESKKSLPDLINVKVDKSIKMLFFGDLMVDRYVNDLIKKNSQSIDFLFKELPESFLNNYDIVGANLEGAVTIEGKHYSPMYSYDFAFQPSVVGQFKDYNFNYFAIANNHLLDQGEKGIQEERKILKEEDILFSGCRDKKISDCSYKIEEIKGKKIGFASFSMVYGILDEDELKTIVEKISKETDYVVVNIHWGQEYQHIKNSTQVKYAKIIIDSGGDVIIGHHPHVVQGMEIYKGKPIFYSLGNFIFDQWFSADTQEGLAISIDLSDKLSIRLIPFKTKKSIIFEMNNDERNNFFKNFIKWSNLSDQDEKQVLSDNKILIEIKNEENN